MLKNYCTLLLQLIINNFYVLLLIISISHCAFVNGLVKVMLTYLLYYWGRKWSSKRLEKHLLHNCPPRIILVVSLLGTKCVVGDRVLVGICEFPEKKILKDGWWNLSMKEIWCLVKNTEMKDLGDRLSVYSRHDEAKNLHIIQKVIQIWNCC